MAEIGTGPVFTKYGNDLAHIGRTPIWLVFEVDGQAWDFSDEPTETGVLRAIPIGTIMHDATICCTKAAAATGTDTLDILISTGTRKVFTGTSDNGGVIDVIDRALVVDGSAFPITAAANLSVLRTISADTGSDLTGGAHYRVSVLLSRPEYDR